MKADLILVRGNSGDLFTRSTSFIIYHYSDWYKLTMHREFVGTLQHIRSKINETKFQKLFKLFPNLLETIYTEYFKIRVEYFNNVLCRRWLWWRCFSDDIFKTGTHKYLKFLISLRIDVLNSKTLSFQRYN